MISVVIPYYQRSAGILRKALASVEAQVPPGLPIHVIIVDDASPVPAEPEIVNFSTSQHSIEVIHQANGGPGAARNAGLDNVPKGTRFIAFLDSDDEWSPHHLQRAIQTMNSGYDFYFADLLQLDASVSAFKRGGRLQLENHPRLTGLAHDLHQYSGDLFDQIIRGNLIGTSTVVYDYERHRSKRFPVEFLNAGEDYLFWMGIASDGARVAFSSQCEARYGKGVNVYAGSGWGTEQHLSRLHNEIKYRRSTRIMFHLNEAQHRHVASCLVDLRMAFARDLLHRIKHSKGWPWQLLYRHFKLDPWTFFALPINLINVVFRRSL